MAIMKKQCVQCSHVFMFEVREAEWIAYQDGAFVQDAFPNMDAADRELFVSGICGSCFDSMFG